MQFLIGLVMLLVGSLTVAKSEKVLEMFGRMEFFETKMGTAGGSRLGYKLIGLVLVFFGILTMTGLIDGFMNWMLSPLLKYTVPQ
jgi:hypothetical protein